MKALRLSLLKRSDSTKSTRKPNVSKRRRNESVTESVGLSSFGSEKTWIKEAFV